MLKLTNLLGDEAGALLLIPVSANEWAQRMEHRNLPPDSRSSTEEEVDDDEFQYPF